MNAPASLRPAAPLSGTDLVVDGLRCASCIAKLEHGLLALEGVFEARVNFTTRRLHVAHDPALPPDMLIADVEKLGFAAHMLAETRAVDRESKRLARALAVAAFAAMNVMLLSVSVWSGADGATRALFHWLSALIALPAIAYAGRPFFESAWRALRRGRTNMDVPISIGITLTCAMSLYETAVQGPHAYFDGAIMLIAFLLGGRLLDSVMRERAQDAVASLLRKLPDDVRVVHDDGQVRSVAMAEVRPDMRVLIPAGDRIGVDGVVEAGASDVDRSIVTGESAPEPVEVGGIVLAGTMNLTSPLTVRVSATASDTVVADIARLMEAAGQHKSRYVRIADRASRLYAPAVHLLAALSLTGWLIAGAGWHEALLIAVAVLIITCPCALGLAVPVAQVVASGALMRRGILVRDGAALEKLAGVDTVLLDKTGTVTLGHLTPVAGMPEDPEHRRILLALALATRHPHARAIARTLEGDGVVPALASELREVVGIGVEATFDGRRAALGRHGWVETDAQAHDAGRVHTWFGVEGAPATCIRFADALRPDAGASVSRLKKLGLSVQFVSGDSWTVVKSLAYQLGLFARAQMSPADKYAAVSRLEAAGKHVLMVGDGVNDGPALKAASVGMAPSAASDVGRQAADIVFFGDRLMPVPVALAASRRTMRVVRQNFALAIGYNVLAVPLAIAGYVTPLVAALAMSGSSILVVANALRLRGAAR
ncbi:cadmium-translocating P-type ATPase [Sphingomonas psychrotolerans]|uniref:Cadmium-translocating P-type ATPase n=1 Tax=Sphingomonas psychrotolerans TaxID=1327635 RepID=A0ABU3N956_9SPHN|nr:heavy metal translocating P-type ATPase [Sphingomonas psychrotolerans]MDT8761029.1 cadmium-translocating P-type ATPase [Sphingomonas psychrotolerans]